MTTSSTCWRREGRTRRRTEGRRRRRRRGRRRDREPRREGGPFEPAAAAPEELEPEELGGFAEEHEAARPYAHRRRDEEESLGEFEELDLEELEGVDRTDLDEDEFVTESPRALVEEEIDPELEQEIRKEIEEIAELEREMGLRGPEDRGGALDEAVRGGRTGRGRGPTKPPIQEIFRRGDEVLIQVIKESIGTKGPTLSTYISIPGRYLVLMPGLNRVGVSRKIVDEGQRRKLREIMTELNPPKGLAFIVRTAGLVATKPRSWHATWPTCCGSGRSSSARIKKSRARPRRSTRRSDMIIRTIRDIFTSEIDTIWIDEPAAFERLRRTSSAWSCRGSSTGSSSTTRRCRSFHKYGIEEEISKIQAPGNVPLPEGGSIVIDQTEALVAIDVNSGNFRVEDDGAERTAYEMRTWRAGASEIRRPAAPAPRPRRRDRQRLHRHARGAASPRGRAGLARRHQA